MGGPSTGAGRENGLVKSSLKFGTIDNSLALGQTWSLQPWELVWKLVLWGPGWLLRQDRSLCPQVLIGAKADWKPGVVGTDLGLWPWGSSWW